LTPPATTGGAWTESVLYSFSNANGGGNLTSGVVMDASGALYGTTAHGGMAGLGTAFKLTPPSAAGGAWTETVLTDFFVASQGEFPLGGLIFTPNGKLYGTTQGGGDSFCTLYGPGCGTVFELQP